MNSFPISVLFRLDSERRKSKPDPTHVQTARMNGAPVCVPVSADRRQNQHQNLTLAPNWIWRSR